MSAISSGLALTIALAVYFGIGDHNTMVVIPVLASIVATLWPNRIVVAGAMIVTATIVVIGFEQSGVLFGASVALLMLALNTLQATATRIRRRPRANQPAPLP